MNTLTRHPIYMPSLFQNKFVRYGLTSFLILIALFVVLVVLSVLSSARPMGLGFSQSTSFDAPNMPEVGMMAREYAYDDMDGAYAEEMAIVNTTSYPIPSPTPNDYTADLEAYETTSYNITGATREFDAACGALTELKARSVVHFKSLEETTNRCSATFYSTEAEAQAVVETLTGFKDVEYTRNTSSVTRHRQQLESRTAILETQLAQVDQMLTTGKAQYERLAAAAEASGDIESLVKATRYQQQHIENFTNQKINLTSQLNSLYQQSADLEARLDVVEFSVYLTRFDPISIGDKARKWQRAWDELDNQFTDTLIGLSAFFGIFILWVIRISIYLVVVLIFVRLLWKVGLLIWKKL